MQGSCERGMRVQNKATGEQFTADHMCRVFNMDPEYNFHMNNIDWPSPEMREHGRRRGRD